MHSFSPSWKAGIEINPRVEEVSLVANWRALAETTSRPALIFGTSSDRIGTPAGQSYFVTASKSLHHSLGVPVAPYAGMSWSTYEDRLLFPFGLTLALGPHAQGMLLYDGVHTHLSSTFRWKRVVITLLAVRGRDAGITIGTAF